MMSISPISSFFSRISFWLAVTFREREPMLIPVFLNLSSKLDKCCEVNRVVGTRIQVCLLLRAEIKAALMATSVFPKPTSPHINLSIGLGDCISCKTSFIVLS